MKHTQFVSQFAMGGFVVVAIPQGVTISEVYWQPSAFLTAIYFLWCLTAVILIFLYFLGTFVEIGDNEIEEKLQG